MLNIHTQHKFKYAHQQILFVKLIYSIQVLGPWQFGAIGHFFSSVVGHRKGPSGANGIKMPWPNALPTELCGLVGSSIIRLH